ncbi:MAG: DUF5947 family protein, partial [Firmicutes bacterium]|nr:DUF5947 family protein [Bacillota bacterium]
PGPGAPPEVYYPGPAGAVRGSLPPGLWEAWEGRFPAVAALQPEVEVLWVDRTPAGTRAWVLPLDRCYEAVGRLRLAGPEWPRALQAVRQDLEQAGGGWPA